MAAQPVFNLSTGIYVPSVGVSLPVDSPELSEIPHTDLQSPQLVMLANVALSTETALEEEKQMFELKNVSTCDYSDTDDENVVRYSYQEEVENVYESPVIVEKIVENLTEPVKTPKPTDFSPKAPVSSEQSKLKKNQNKRVTTNTAGLVLINKKKEKPFFCKPCHFQAKSEEEFVQHIRVHSAKKLIAEKKGSGNSDNEQSSPASPNSQENCMKGVIECERCGYNTNRYDHYLAHLRHHKNEGDKQQVFKCIICPYSTISQYHWKKHLRNHFPSKLFTCDQCSYFSDRKNNYIQHIRTHTGERPFRCTVCDYSSSQKTHLTRHVRKHTGERPFKCETCSYLAANQHEVTRHARQVHGGPKPFQCPYCEYKTADRSNFKKHVELHINPHQFLCPVCEYAASKKCNLQYHIKSKHPDCSDITMDVSRVRLRVKKVEKSEPKEGQEPSEEEESIKDTDSALGPINLSIRNGENAKNSPFKSKERSIEKKAERRRATVRYNTTKKIKNKEDGKKEKGVKKVTKAREKLRNRTQQEEKILKCKSTKEKDAPEEERMKKERQLSEQKQKEEERKEKGRLEEEMRKKQQKEEDTKRERERFEKERLEKERLEKERLEKERLEKERLEKKRLEKERLEKKRLEKERLEKKRLEKERLEKKRLEKERLEKEKLEKERLEKERLEQERLEKEMLERERLEQERIENERLKNEQIQKEEEERKERERLEKEKQEKEQKEKRLKERLEKERLEIERSKKQQQQRKREEQREQECLQKLQETEKKKTSKKQTRDSQKGVELKSNAAKRKAESSPPPQVEKRKKVKVMIAPPVTSPVLQAFKGQKRTRSQNGKDSTDKMGKVPAKRGRPSPAAKASKELMEAVSQMQENPKPAADQALAARDLEVDSGTDSPTLDLSKPPCSKSQFAEDDEGIHSHDGASEISDSVSEVSYDSGLNGKLPETPTDELPSPTQLINHLCVFCDRTFPLEIDYRRHLNRHLVNVYYLDSASRRDK